MAGMLIDEATNTSLIVDHVLAPFSPVNNYTKFLIVLSHDHHPSVVF